MKEYKVLAFGQRWTTRALISKATAQINDCARIGWRVLHFQHGWSGFFFVTLYVLLERETQE